MEYWDRRGGSGRQASAGWSELPRHGGIKVVGLWGLKSRVIGEGMRGTTDHIGRHGPRDQSEGRGFHLFDCGARGVSCHRFQIHREAHEYHRGTRRMVHLGPWVQGVMSRAVDLCNGSQISLHPQGYTTNRRIPWVPIPCRWCMFLPGVLSTRRGCDSRAKAGGRWGVKGIIRQGQ